MVQSACFVVRCAVFVHFHLFHISHHLVQLFLSCWTDPQVVDTGARSSESKSDSRMKEIRQVLTKQVLSPTFASPLESWLQKWLRHEIMRPGSAAQVIFLLYVPWGRSHSRWCFVACESEFTEWQPAAEELKINLLMANGGSSPCWHFVVQHARRAWVYGSFGIGHPRCPNLRLEYTTWFCSVFCSLNVPMLVAEKSEPVCRFWAVAVDMFLLKFGLGTMWKSGTVVITGIVYDAQGLVA